MIAGFILLILFALFLEAWIESVYGDAHGAKSNIVLGLIIIMFELIGIKLFGFKYGWFYYISFRFLIFDYIFSYMKHGHIWYLGNNFTDNISKKFNKWVLFGARAVLLIIITFRLL